MSTDKIVSAHSLIVLPLGKLSINTYQIKGDFNATTTISKSMHSIVTML